MSVDALIILSGILVAILAVLPRFPDTVETALFLILGVAIIVFGIVVRRRTPTARAPRTRESFTESVPREMVHDDAA